MAPAAASAAERGAPAPRLSAAAAILVDGRSGQVLHARNAGRPRAIASATKLMTALLVLEQLKLRDFVTAPGYTAQPAESQIGLRKGERMTVQDMLSALLLASANDAAVALATRVAGSRRAFVREMNARARRLGLAHTHFGNPIGLDQPNNYSSARDLASLARRLLADRRFAAIVDRQSAELRSGARRRVVTNRNPLVGRYPFVDGVKTGHTLRAGYVLVGSATLRGERVISVVLGEPSAGARDLDSLALLRYGLDQFRRTRVLSAASAIARPRVSHSRERAALTTPTDVFVTLRRGERAAIRIQAPEEIRGPLAAGRRVGSVRIIYGGRAIRTVPLVTARAVPGAGFFRIVTSALGVPLTLVALVAIVLAATLVPLRLRAVRMRRARTTTAASQ